MDGGKTLSHDATFEHKLPECSECEEIVEWVNDNGLCESCEKDMAVNYMESRNDRD